MKRRTLLKAVPLGLLPLAGDSLAWLELVSGKCCTQDPTEDVKKAEDDDTIKLEEQTPPARHRESDHSIAHDANHPGHGKVDLQKIKEFDQRYPGDFILDPHQLTLLKTVFARLQRAQRYIGHGNFNLLSFDHLLFCGENYSAIGAFSLQELYFMEDIFFANARRYGFYGARVTHDLTAVVPMRDIKKIGRTGHFLFRGQPLQKYESIRAELGSGITLTSGIRGIVKQMQLFLAKAVVTNGNLSQASRSLAPPGYSYHGIGDFDLGKVGFGLRNFTESFATTDEYKRLIDLGYVSIRYTETNPFGVRHEPWHIKIA
ncbi:MAG: M15 family metallopeptidase [Pseudomonadales bacterium]